MVSGRRDHLLLILFILVMVIGLLLYFGGAVDERLSSDLTKTSRTDDVYRTLDRIINQRNNISRMLNLKQQKIGQIECEALKKSNLKVSSSGGWCPRISMKQTGYRHKTDENLVPKLAEIFIGKNVASFGDGQGGYKQLLLGTGLLKGYDSYDGAPFSETTSEGRVQYLDLTLPQYGLPLYDWVMSLEVAEHIPKQYETVYLDNIVRHAKEGIVLSWAVPGQGGYSHINNRPLDYVINMFDKLGFYHDVRSSEKLQEAAYVPWLKRNTNVYRRKKSSRVENNMQ